MNHGGVGWGVGHTQRGEKNRMKIEQDSGRQKVKKKKKRREIDDARVRQREVK